MPACDDILPQQFDDSTADDGDTDGDDAAASEEPPRTPGVAAGMTEKGAMSSAF